MNIPRVRQKLIQTIGQQITQHRIGLGVAAGYRFRLEAQLVQATLNPTLLATTRVDPGRSVERTVQWIELDSGQEDGVQFGKVLEVLMVEVDTDYSGVKFR